MADDVTFQSTTPATPASGTVVAADVIGGVAYQRVKLTHGADNTATDVSSASPLEVTLANTGANATAVKVDASSVAVPITDNAGSLTVDGTVAATQSGTWTVQPGNTANTTAWKVDASSVAVPVTDNSGTLTVDAPVGTPVFVRLSDGAAAITALPITDNAGSLTVDGTVAASNLPATVDTNSGNKSASTLRVVLATDQPQLTNKLLVTPDANSAVNVAQVNGVTPLMGNGVTGTGSMRVTIASDNTANTNPFLVSDQAATSGGMTYSQNSIKATATSIKASAGQVYGWYIYNGNTSVSYVQFFNTASGSVSLGSTAPVYSLGIPASSGANAFVPNGIAHSTAIVVAATTTVNGSSAPANNVDINIFYK